MIPTPSFRSIEGSTMLRSPKAVCWVGLLVVSSLVAPYCGPQAAHGGVTSEEVELAIKAAVRFLKERQKVDGSWPDVDIQAKTGVTSLVAVALLTAGEKPESQVIQNALKYLRQFKPDDLNSTYAVSLQTMVFAAADPVGDRQHIVGNVDFLERGQLKLGDRIPWPGSWNYLNKQIHPGDNSNSQYALLGLNAAIEAGVSVNPQVLALARAHFELSQNRDGGWAYTPRDRNSTASMTCAGISSLILTGSRPYEGLEYLQGDAIHECGKGGFNAPLMRGIDWLSQHFDVSQNVGGGQQWKYYYLYGLERAGRLAGMRFFGRNDWYRVGAEKLVGEQQKLSGFWRGGAQENELVATSFALLFLAKGRAPVLINKLAHPPGPDWNNDPDDVRNIVNIISHDWKNLLAWQVVDPRTASVQEMLQAPIAYFNGHQAPDFGPAGRRNLREYIEQGGFLFAEACCGSKDFDLAFKKLIKEILPEEGYQLRPLPPDHPVWRARHLLSPEIHPLWGIEHGCRTIVIYSPQDLSCYWNQVERTTANPAVVKAVHVGQNVIDYATGRELPADKLAVHDLLNLKADAPKRGALRIAKLKHAADWNVAPQAIPNLMEALRRPPLRFDVVITQKDLYPRDPNLIYYPFVYIHGRGAISFDKADMDALRHHLDPGGGTLFADAACGSKAFDAAFRRFIAELLPNHPLVPIPNSDPLMTAKVGFELKDVVYTPAAGGAHGFPKLEGVKINDRWVIIYSPFDIGCALERHSGIDCKGYVHDSAVKIAANIVIYSALP
jgi:hypothetical protein